jgi:hypothetical protein
LKDFKFAIESARAFINQSIYNIDYFENFLKNSINNNILELNLPGTITDRSINSPDQQIQIYFRSDELKRYIGSNKPQVAYKSEKETLVKLLQANRVNLISELEEIKKIEAQANQVIESTHF